MKTKRILALVITVIMLCCTLTAPVSATDITVEEHTEFYFENDNISEESKERMIALVTDDDGNEADSQSSARGITCSLFGHKLESSTLTKISHKVRSSSPRCLKSTYACKTCSRCDYEEAELVSSTYIICCS